MMRFLLINPNTSEATTEQMTAIARAVVLAGVEVIGATARRGPPMILTTEELGAAEAEVLEVAAARGVVDGIIIAAFGDPGIEALRQRAEVPVVGIAEASMLAAATGGRRFGIATTTPALVCSIARYTERLGIAAQYTGIRLTAGDPLTLVADPKRLVEALADAVRQSIEGDGAEAVIIGGGPLGDAAIALARRFSTPIVAPIPAAVARLMRALAPAT
jgi:allantoin racemase